MAGKKNRITTTTSTSVQDRRIGAEGGSTIVSEGGSLQSSYSETLNLIDSDTAQASVDALQSVSRSALDANAGVVSDAFGLSGDVLRENTDLSRAAIDMNVGLSETLFDRAVGVFDGATDLVGRAFDLSEAAGAAQQRTASEALAKTASEGNQALETITRGAMVIAAAFFVSRIFRG